jgi:hypothetical protein
VNKGLWFGDKLQNTLLNPNQFRYLGVSVAENPFNSAEPLSIVHDDVKIPLLLSDTTIYIETTTPTQSELDHCPHIHLFCESEWNPQTVRLAETQSVEAEAMDDVDVEPGLAQISHAFGSKSLVEAMSNRCALK